MTSGRGNCGRWMSSGRASRARWWSGEGSSECHVCGRQPGRGWPRPSRGPWRLDVFGGGSKLPSSDEEGNWRAATRGWSDGSTGDDPHSSVSCRVCDSCAVPSHRSPLLSQGGEHKCPISSGHGQAVALRSRRSGQKGGSSLENTFFSNRSLHPTMSWLGPTPL